MGYWAGVHKRALRATLELIRLERPARAAMTIGLIVVPAALMWIYAADAQAGVRGLATLGTLLVAALLAYLSQIAAVPPCLAAEAEEERARLESIIASFGQPDDDEELRDGLAYIMNGSWEFPLWEGGESTIGELSKVVQGIRKQASRGRIHIWGQLTRHQVHQSVPTDFWINGDIDFLGLMDGDLPAQTSADGVQPQRWINLRINRAEFEREWPPRR